MSRFFTFSDQPKLQRWADFLYTRLDECYNDVLQPVNRGGSIDGYDQRAAESNRHGKIRHYVHLLSLARKLKQYCANDAIDYSYIRQLACEIKAYKTETVSVTNEPMDFQLSWFGPFQNNLVIDFFAGCWGIIANALIALWQIVWLCIEFFKPSDPPQLSDLVTELVQTAKDWCESLYKVIRSVIFPVSMLDSFYHTGSLNVIKGDLARTVDSIIAEAGRLAGPAPSRYNSLDGAMA